MIGIPILNTMSSISAFSENQTQREIKLKDLPNEILINIFSYFNSTDIKKYIFSLKPFVEHIRVVIAKYDLAEEAKHLKITVPGWYILQRKSHKSNKTLKQIVHIDKFHKSIKNNKKKIMYEYNYGIWSYHVGYCLIDNILHLNSKEKDLVNNRQFFKLPQQFYHSDMDDF